MESFIQNSFITPLSATAALLPYIGTKTKLSSPSTISSLSSSSSTYESLSSTTVIHRPNKQQRIEASIIVIQQLKKILDKFKDPSFALSTNPGISSLSSINNDTTNKENIQLNTKIFQFLLHDNINHPHTTENIKQTIPVPSTNLLEQSTPILSFTTILWSKLATHTTTSSTSSTTYSWLFHIFIDMLIESFDIYCNKENILNSSNTSTDNLTTEDKVLLLPESLGLLIQNLKFFHIQRYRIVLQTVIKTIITKYIRNLVINGDTETSIRIHCLQWVAEKLLPWISTILFTNQDLINISTILTQHKELFLTHTLSTIDNNNTFYTEQEYIYIQALRIAHILPTSLPLWPHPHLGLVFTGGFANVDDGTGGNTYISSLLVNSSSDIFLPTVNLELNSSSLETVYTPTTTTLSSSSNTSVLPTSVHSIQLAYTLGELLLLLKYYDQLCYYHVQSCICQARTEQAFDLIRDYPESLPALYDLRDTLPILGESAQAKLISTLTAALRNRLLHPGVATSSILDVFLSTVRCLRIIEGENDSMNINTGGILLSLIIDPIQCYLRTRADTIRCIVSSLTEDTESELYSELVRKDTKVIVENKGGDDSDDEDGIPPVSNVNNNIPMYPEQKWNMNASFLQTLIENNNETNISMTDNDETNNTNSLSIIKALYYILGTQFRYSLPTNPYLRGKHLYHDSTAGIYSSLDNNQSMPLSYGNRIKGLWYPSPIIIDSVQTIGLNSNRINNTNRYNDLLSLLVNIYGSKEMFVTEYRTMLSDRLLTKPPKDYDISNEERTVELLKLRFGDTALISTEIMLRDVIESKRVSLAITNGLNKKNFQIQQYLSSSNTNEQENTTADNNNNLPVVCQVYDNQTNVDAIILSHKYWPILPREQPTIAPLLTTLFKAVATEYAEAKKPRELLFVPSLGEIEVEIEIPLTEEEILAQEEEENNHENDEDMDISKSEIVTKHTKTMIVTGNLQQISILLHMAGKQSISLKELSSLLNVSNAQCLRNVSYWINKGILVIQRNYDTQEDMVWLVSCVPKENPTSNTNSNTNLSGHPSTTTNIYDDQHMDNGDDLNTTMNNGDNPEAIMLWHSYIFGMLNNLGSMPIDRIYNTLKMFASMGDYPYEKSLNETTRFLADMVRSDKLELADGMYSLKN